MELLGLAILLFGAKLGGVAFKKLKQPSVAGEVLAGVILGPSVFSLVTKTPLIEAISELGLIFLVLLISMMIDWRRLENRAETLGWIELVRALITFGAVFLIGLYVGWDFYTNIVISLIAVNTSTAFVSRILLELNEMKTSVGETLMAINVVGDMVGIIAITILAGFISTSTLNVFPIFTIVVLLIGFFVVMGKVGGRAVNKITTVIQKYGVDDVLLPFTLMIAFLFGVLTEELKLASLVGVFFAGMLLSKSNQYATAAKKVKDLGESFFIPIFFGSIGLAFSLAAVYSHVYFILALMVVLIGVKWLTTSLTFRMFRFSNEDSMKLGSGMISLSELTVVMASMAFATVNPAMFGVFIVLFISISIVAPLITMFAFKRSVASGDRGFKASGSRAVYNFKKD
jgi:Kef-type K+ transport system membrane component KefB